MSSCALCRWRSAQLGCRSNSLAALRERGPRSAASFWCTILVRQFFGNVTVSEVRRSTLDF